MNKIEVTLTWEIRQVIALRLGDFLIQTRDELALSEFEVLLAVMSNLGNLTHSLRVMPGEVTDAFHLGFNAAKKGKL